MFDCFDSIKIFLCFVVLINFSFWLLYLPITFVRYVNCSTNLICIGRPKMFSSVPLIPSLYCIYIVLIVENIESLLILLLNARDCRSFSWSLKSPIVRNIRVLLYMLLAYHLATIPVINIATIAIRLIYDTYSSLNLIPLFWVCFLIILLSNDVEMNPGDFTNSFFRFVTGT